MASFKELSLIVLNQDIKKVLPLSVNFSLILFENSHEKQYEKMFKVSITNVKNHELHPCYLVQ